MRRKICNICNEPKDINDFSNNKAKKDGKNYYCMECGRKNNKKYYLKNKEKYKARSSYWRRQRKVKRLEFVLSYLKERGCIDCGEKNPVVLEFDHVRGKKYRTICKMLSRSEPMDRLKKEIKKCDVRCANCHRIKTAKQLNWYEGIDIDRL